MTSGAARCCRTSFDVFVDAYLSHGETYTDDAVSGAALWAAPDTDPLSGSRSTRSASRRSPASMRRGSSRSSRCSRHMRRTSLTTTCNSSAYARSVREPASEQPSWRPILQRCDRDGMPAYLEATSDRNRALYESHGFQARDDIPLPGGPASGACGATQSSRARARRPACRCRQAGTVGERDCWSPALAQARPRAGAIRRRLGVGRSVAVSMRPQGQPAKLWS
jgi:hypothetical protein